MNNERSINDLAANQITLRRRVQPSWRLGIEREQHISTEQ
jgi:hypothetical protein